MIRVGTCLGLAGSVGEKQRCHRGFRDHASDAECSLVPEKLTKSGRRQGRCCWDTGPKGLILGTRAEELQAVGTEVFWVQAPQEEGVSKPSAF